MTCRQHNYMDCRIYYCNKLQTQRANFRKKGFNKFTSVKEKCIILIISGLGYYKF
jgi:hypothetical protein